LSPTAYAAATFISQMLLALLLLPVTQWLQVLPPSSESRKLPSLTTATPQREWNKLALQIDFLVGSVSFVQVAPEFVVFHMFPPFPAIQPVAPANVIDRSFVEVPRLFLVQVTP